MNTKEFLAMGRYTDLGGYPIFACTDNGEVYSYDYVSSNEEEFDDVVLHAEVNWESLLYCDGSGEQIESAYEVVIYD